MSHLFSQYSVHRLANTSDSEKHHSKEIMRYLSGGSVYFHQNKDRANEINKSQEKLRV